MSYKIGIVGASGYTGAELLRLLAHHPEFEVATVTAHSAAGREISAIHPHLYVQDPITAIPTDCALDKISECDLVFSALPHGESMAILPELSCKVVDLASDFRLKREESYAQWYGRVHEVPEFLTCWEYGIPEFFRDEYGETRLIANPGCYATAVLLGLLPLVEERLVGSTVVVDACSGTTGAGKKPSPTLHYSNLYESVAAYKIGRHQHIAEIEETCARVAPGQAPLVSMTAHLVPMARGIHATISCEVARDTSQDEIAALFEERYAEEPFVRVAPTPPATKEVRGTNMALVHPVYDERTSRIIVTSVIDNLVKGAAGQAIQNANLLLNLEETSGLLFNALYP